MIKISICDDNREDIKLAKSKLNEIRKNCSMILKSMKFSMMRGE